jgi:hypothetical protein
LYFSLKSSDSGFKPAPGRTPILKKIIPLSLILVAGALLRIQGIDYGLPTQTHRLFTYHPDEAVNFNNLAEIKEFGIFYFPKGAEVWGGKFHLWPFAAVLQIAKTAGYVHGGDRSFYMEHLEEADRLYLVTRGITLLFGLFCILGFYAVASTAYDWETGLLAAGLCSISMIFVTHSFILRPETQMILLGLGVLFFLARNLNSPDWSNLLWSGALVGAAISTKYTAGVYGVALLLSLPFTSVQNRQKLIWAFAGSAISLLSFIVTSPALWADPHAGLFKSLRHCAGLQKQLAESLWVLHVTGTGASGFLFNSLPYAVGWGMTIAGLIALIFLCWSLFLKRGQPFDCFLIASGLVSFVLLAKSSAGAPEYTMPVLPFILLWTARAGSLALKWSMGNSLRKIFVWTVLLLCFGYTGAYTLAMAKVYGSNNILGASSRWIESQLAPGTRVGVLNFSWIFFGALRGYNPFSELWVAAEYGKPKLSMTAQDPVLTMNQIRDQVDYWVLTEHDTIYYLHPKMRERFPQQVVALERVMKEWPLAAYFQVQPEFAGLAFSHQNPPPSWLHTMKWIAIYRNPQKNSRHP